MRLHARFLILYTSLWKGTYVFIVKHVINLSSVQSSKNVVVSATLWTRNPSAAANRVWTLGEERIIPRTNRSESWERRRPPRSLQRWGVGWNLFGIFIQEICKFEWRKLLSWLIDWLIDWSFLNWFIIDYVKKIIYSKQLFVFAMKFENKTKRETISNQSNYKREI